MTKQTPRPATHIPGGDRRSGSLGWGGVVDGAALDADLTILFFQTDEIGKGPSWHVHPYDEVFIIRRGRARFTIGDEVIDAEAGDVMLGPAAVPHKYHNLGPGPLETTDIHLSREWIQTDLVDPDE